MIFRVHQHFVQWIVWGSRSVRLFGGRIRVICGRVQVGSGGGVWADSGHMVVFIRCGGQQEIENVST